MLYDTNVQNYTNWASLFISTNNNNVCFTKPSEEMKLMMMLSKTNILQANGEIKKRILTKNIFVFLWFTSNWTAWSQLYTLKLLYVLTMTFLPKFVITSSILDRMNYIACRNCLINISSWNIKFILL